MVAQAGVGALVHVGALVQRVRELVALRTAALVRAGQVHAGGEPATRAAPAAALVDVAADVRCVVVLVSIIQLTLYKTRFELVPNKVGSY